MPVPRLAVVQDLGILVKDLADAMAAILADHRVAVCSTCFWTAAPTSPRRLPGASSSMPSHMASLAMVERRLRKDIFLTNHEHTAGVAVKTVLDHRDVDIDGIARISASCRLGSRGRRRY